MNPYQTQFNGPPQSWYGVKTHNYAPAGPQYTYSQPVQYSYTQPRNYGYRPCRQGYEGYRNTCYPQYPQQQSSSGKRGFGDFLKSALGNFFKGAAFGAGAGGVFGLISSFFRR